MHWGDVPTCNNLAAALKDTGQLDEAIQSFDQAIATEPANAAIASNRLFVLHFHPAYEAADLLKEHLYWNEKHARPLAETIRPHANDRSPDRRLKIGYVSGDFRQHPVGQAIEPLIDNHDREKFEVFCFSNSSAEDAVTKRISAAADHWEVVAGWTDEKVADTIRERGIDILVDLSLHMGLNRMLTFAKAGARAGNVPWLSRHHGPEHDGLPHQRPLARPTGNRRFLHRENHPSSAHLSLLALERRPRTAGRSPRRTPSPDHLRQPQ